MALFSMPKKHPQCFEDAKKSTFDITNGQLSTLE
jgi:hypothetical protein